jgi:hypothetical protein
VQQKGPQLKLEAFFAGDLCHRRVARTLSPF